MSIVNSISGNMRALLPQCLKISAEDVIRDIYFYCSMPNNFFGGSDITGTMHFSLPHTVKTTKEICNSPGAVVKTVFAHTSKPGVEGIHHFWKESGKACESLTVTGSNEVVKQCYEGKFEGRLLSQVCTDADTYTNSSPPSIAQVIGGVVGAVGLFKAVQELRDGNKARALAWTVFGIAAIALPNIDFK